MSLGLVQYSSFTYLFHSFTVVYSIETNGRCLAFIEVTTYSSTVHSIHINGFLAASTTFTSIAFFRAYQLSDNIIFIPY